MALSISTITKIFNTGFIRRSPTATSQSEISWSSLSNLSGGSISGTIDKNVLHQEFIQVLEDMFKSRDNYYKAVEAIQSSDKSLEILDQLIDEILNAVSAQRPFTPAVKNTVLNAKEIIQVCDELNNDCDIYRYDRDMLRRLLLFGEVFIGTTLKTGKGIIELDDTLDGKNIIPLYKGYKIQEYISMPKDQKSTFNAIQKPIRIDRNLITHFVISPNRYTLNNNEEFKLFNTQGFSVLLGVSILYPALGKLYRLQNLENTADMQALSQASSEQLIGVPVIDSVKPTDYEEIARTYRNFLKPVFGEGISGNNQSYNSNTGKFKILPFPQGQGKPESISFDKPDLTILENKVKELADSIDNALGTNDSDGTRVEVYAKRSRLVRRLMDVLEARRLGWKEIYLRHLTFKGIYVDPADFDVQMAALPDYEVFVEAESLAHLLESLRDTFNFAQDALSSGMVGAVDTNCLVNLFEKFAGNRFTPLKGLFTSNDIVYAEGKEPQEMEGGSDHSSTTMNFSGGPGGLEGSVDLEDFNTEEPSTEEPNTEEPNTEEPTANSEIEEPEA